MVAIVVPFHYPTAEADLKKFSDQFGLPECATGCLQIIPAAKIDCLWAREAALALQWVHAMAPNAKLLLFEVDSANGADLLSAVKRAAQIVKDAGGSEVLMTWSLCRGLNCEFQDEAKYDEYFIDGVTYFASSGDNGGVPAYPSTSPNVVGVGGTVIRDATPGAVVEKGWINSGGGNSKYERKPSF